MEENLTLKKVQEKFPQHLKGTEDLKGEACLLVSADGLRDVVGLLKNDPELDYNFLIDLAGADYLKYPQEKPGRYCVAYQFLSLSRKARVCLKVYLPDDPNPVVPSLCPLYAAANWFEREAFDMFGVKFDGHPNLKRLLLYEEFEGHPLRKDYPIGKMQPLIPMRDAIDYEQVRIEMRKKKAQEIGDTHNAS